MAHEVKEIKPKEWTEDEAFSSGQGGYRIKVELSGNPFNPGTLAASWAAGWNDAASKDTFSKKRIDYATEERNERHHDKRRLTDTSRPRNRGGSSFPRSQKH